MFTIDDIYIVLIVSGVLLMFMGIEGYRYLTHLHRLKKIPHRIHINGSRGKSSTTRCMGAALRGDGLITVTKTTGTAPRFIYPDGTEVPVFRAGKPNIIEQLKVVKRADSCRCSCLIAECMAITPEYISTIEKQIIKSTIGVITNVREDHLDVMGPSVKDVAINLTRSLPKNGIAFTAEKKWFNVMNEEAKKKGTKLIQVKAESITDQEMEGFPYIEHKENVAIALAVADHLGVPRNKALERMYTHTPDPGVLVEVTIRKQTGTIYFYNALAANDPDSSLIIWNMALKRRQFPGTVLLIIRADREQRTEGFANILGKTIIAQRYIIAGSPVDYVRGRLRKNGVSDNAIVTLEKPDATDVVKAIYDFPKDQVMVAMGNIVGLGDSTMKILEKDALDSKNYQKEINMLEAARI